MFSNKHKPYKYGFDPFKPPLTPLDQVEKIPFGQEGRFLPSADSCLWLFSRSWVLPPKKRKDTKATLIICHGTVDHSGVYHELATALVNVGIAVFAQDMRGWGLSDGESMYLNDMEAFVEDVDCFYEEIHKRPEYATVANRFILGKSIGGLVSAYSVIQHPFKYTGLLGLSGAYKTHSRIAVSPMPARVVQALNAFAPKFPLKQIFDPTLIVKDPDALRKWYDDPLCSKDKVRCGYAIEAWRCKHELPKLVGDIDTPMFMMIGDDDQVVSLEGLEMMVNCKMEKNWDYYFLSSHAQLLAEPSLKDEVIGDIKDWILHRVWVGISSNAAQ